MLYLNKLLKVLISVFLGCTLLFHSIAVFGQVNSEAEKKLRNQLNKTLPDTDRIKVQLKLSMLYFCVGISKPFYLDSTRALYSSAEVLSKTLHSVNWENECLSVKARYYFEKGDFKKAEASLKQLIGNQKVGHDTLKMANSWHFAAALLPAWSYNLCEGKILCLTHAYGMYQALHDKLDVIGTLKDEADAHLNQGRLDLAERELLQVVGQYRSIHYTKLHHTYYLLSQVYRLKGNLHKELYYCLETVKTMQATGDSTSASLFYIKLSDVYDDLGMYNNSLVYLNKVLVRSQSDQTATSACLSRIIKLLIKENKKEEALAFLKKNVISASALAKGAGINTYMALANCYFALGQYKRAEPYIKKMIYAAEDVDYVVNNPMEANLGVYNLACNFFLKTNRYAEAKIYLQKLQELPREHITPVFRSGMELFQYKIDSAAGNYITAMKHFEQFKMLTDSIFNATKSKQIEELQISYETSQKDKDIQLLKKQSIIDQGKFERKKLTENLALGGLALLLILLGLLYSRYQLKQRNLLLLQKKQKEITSKNVALERLLHDNEWLMREVHHRVKNNLQIVMSLLHSQSAYLKDEIALNAVMDSRHRVQAMSLIHQKLYKSDNASNIYMPEYIGELIEYLKDSFKTGLQVVFKLEIAPISMDVLHAIPIGLILNEVITNALKYAFPYTENDTILVKLKKEENESISLLVSDNGRGLPTDFDIEEINSFGMLLVKGLIEDLEGDFIIESIAGTCIRATLTTTLLAKEDI